MAGRSTVRVTYDREAGFLVWCEDCNEGWPLTTECWNQARGLTRCRACWRERAAEWIADRRADPAYRAEELAAHRATYYARNRRAVCDRARRRYHQATTAPKPLAVVAGLTGVERRRAYKAAWTRNARASA
jgi:hypothetical protein